MNTKGFLNGFIIYWDCFQYLQGIEVERVCSGDAMINKGHNGHKGQMKLYELIWSGPYRNHNENETDGPFQSSFQSILKSLGIFAIQYAFTIGMVYSSKISRFKYCLYYCLDF